MQFSQVSCCLYAWDTCGSSCLKCFPRAGQMMCRYQCQGYWPTIFGEVEEMLKMDVATCVMRTCKLVSCDFNYCIKISIVMIFSAVKLFLDVEFTSVYSCWHGDSVPFYNTNLWRGLLSPKDTPLPIHPFWLQLAFCNAACFTIWKHAK